MIEARPVIGFEGRYSVTSDGVILSHLQTGRALSSRPAKSGYIHATLRKNGKSYPRYVHRIVASAFLGKCPKGKTVNHKDGCKANNNYTNLEYSTLKEQQAHARAHGLLRIGEDHPAAKLSAADVRLIRKSNLSHAELARQFSVDRRTIERAISRELWSNV